MTDVEKRLRAVTEDDVAAAIAGAYSEAALAALDPMLLVEFTDRLLNHLFGEPPES